MTGAAIPASAAACAGCGVSLPPTLLACPSCHQLVHAGRLKALQAQAHDAAQAGAVLDETAAWRAALDLLPPGSRQHQAVLARLDALARRPASTPLTPDGGKGAAHAGARWAGGLGTAGLLLWKFKFLAIGMFTKGKLLALGLTKASTLLSMALAFGVYWTAWGMWFAAGLILSIYIHEMGHVAALRRYGVPASAPMFVPGVGAFVRLHAAHLAPAEDARIGLAGPQWGLAAAAATLAGAAITGHPLLAAIAHTAAWLNLFNLLPLWQLDGNRGFAALSRRHRWGVCGAFVAAWWVSADGLPVLLAAAAAFRAFDPHAPDTSDDAVALHFVLLIAALAVIVRLSAAAAAA